MSKEMVEKQIARYEEALDQLSHRPDLTKEQKQEEEMFLLEMLAQLYFKKEKE